MELSQKIQISSDAGTKGFDLSAGKIWIYPENYPVRDYQFSIVQACLYNNTLVCLPTGLGKTFIAAVVMYNFWRWYPRGKVVFLAPTKPLVSQQILACHNIMGIPSIETMELTGSINRKQREVAWSKKRVLFATPQVFHNDLEKNIVPGDLVKCVVIDEAHKALGKHSYCECIRILSERTETFRVLALSATPGNKIDNVHEVLQKLLIARIELRDETSPDIVPYINRRKVDIILVPLNDELTEYKDRYVFIMDRHVKFLLQHKVLQGHTANISKGRVFHLLKEHQKKTNKSGNYGQIMKTLNILMTMYHAYALMVRDGLRAFHNFYQNHTDKYWMNEEPQLQALLKDIDTYLGPFPDVKTLRGEPLIPEILVFGHTKFSKLKELLIHHFKSNEGNQHDTKAIVFVEYRDIVSEIYILLVQCKPLIRPQIFVGQAGLKQKQQVRALEDFRNNHVNVLISTSIGEEGLDVGEVDLIICFDISQHSPTRLVQRMGRTGRKRDGHIIMLVTDGNEHETLKSTIARRDSLNHKVLNGSNIFSSLYQNNPRMVPDIFTPECLKIHITVQPKSPITKRRNCKGKLKKEENKRQNVRKEIAGIGTQKDGTKFSMVKYLKGEQRIDHTKNTFQISGSVITQNSNIPNSIKMSDVKILSCDNDAVEFLTICALKNSEKESDVKIACKFGQLYLPEPCPITNFFNFSIPDIAIVQCLDTLHSTVPLYCDKKDLDTDGETNDKGDSFANDCIFENAMTDIDGKCNLGESKFEDILDDSSVSDEENVLVRKVKLARENDALESFGTEDKINTLKDFEPGEFENILNDTSSGSGTNDRYDYVFEQIAMVDRHIHSNLPVKKSGYITKSDADSGDGITGLQKAWIEEKNDFVASRQSERNDEIDEETNKNSFTRDIFEISNQNVFSITQTIATIGRLNSNTTASKFADESDDDMFEDDDSCLLQAESRPNVDGEASNLVEQNDRDNVDISRSLDERGSIGAGTEFNTEEYEWDETFEISDSPVQSCTDFGASDEKAKNVVGLGCPAEARISAARKEWFSEKRSSGISRDDTPRPSIAKKLLNIRNELNASSSGRVEENREKRIERVRKYNRGGKLNRKRNVFIDDEAKVSSRDDTMDESSESDKDLEDFVSYTQAVHDTSDMLAHYLQDTRSPVKTADGFIFKQPRALHSDVYIYSQPVTEIDESYIYDSFCVRGDEGEGEGEVEGEDTVRRIEELSELEEAELRLKRNKPKRKRKRDRYDEICRDAEAKMRGKKRRNVINKSSSSEDETEKLRAQIENDTMLLARSSERN